MKVCSAYINLHCKVYPIYFIRVMIIFLDFECKRQFAIIEFEKPVYCAANSMVIGSRLDTDAYILYPCLRI